MKKGVVVGIVLLVLGLFLGYGVSYVLSKDDEDAGCVKEEKVCESSCDAQPSEEELRDDFAIDKYMENVDFSVKDFSIIGAADETGAMSDEFSGAFYVSSFGNGISDEFKILYTLSYIYERVKEYDDVLTAALSHDLSIKKDNLLNVAKMLFAEVELVESYEGLSYYNIGKVVCEQEACYFEVKVGSYGDVYYSGYVHEVVNTESRNGQSVVTVEVLYLDFGVDMFADFDEDGTYCHVSALEFGMVVDTLKNYDGNLETAFVDGRKYFDVVPTYEFVFDSSNRLVSVELVNY